MKILFTLWFCGFSILCFGQKTYTSRTYGISFTYPQAWNLKEGDLGGGESEMGYLGSIPMEFIAPGGMRVVTVETPKDAYPGTDLVIAFFTMNVNQHLIKKECEEFPEDVSGIRKRVIEKIGGITFHGLEQAGAAMSHQFGGTYYHGFSGGLCFELGEGIATSGYGVVDGIKKVDESMLSAILDGISRTVSIRVPKR